MSEEVIQTDFKTAQAGPINIISCPNLNSHEIEEILRINIKAWMLLPVHLHLLDFSKVEIISLDACRAFAVLNKTLKQNNKALATIKMTTAVKSFVKEHGLDDVFSPVNNIVEAKLLAKIK